MPSDMSTGYFNPRAPCGARLLHVDLRVIHVVISIHAPHAGRDCHLIADGVVGIDFNPRALCGARLMVVQPLVDRSVFQSTRPMRGATVSILLTAICPSYFNPRAPCGARQFSSPVRASPVHFNPRAPCGARHQLPVRPGDVGSISIHAPHAGRDCLTDAADACMWNFNPRAPCGARRWQPDCHYPSPPFQSTRPMRGATR